jgi:molybdopterin synthase sulfur carrier subunit
MIKVKLFGITREIVGESTLSIDTSLASVDELLAYMKKKYPEMQRLNSLLVAVNSEYADPGTQLDQADEIALIPPVSGG